MITHAYKCEIALEKWEEYIEKHWGFMESDFGFGRWLKEQIEQEELLEIEKDVLRQQEGLIKGE